MALLINLGNDPWLSEYESCDKLHREIMEKLSIRSKEPRSSEKYLQLSATIRIRLKQFSNELDQLKVKLNQESKTTAITHEEIERRYRLIEILQSKYVQMQKLFENANVTNIVDRKRLMGTNSAQDAGVSEWGNSSDDVPLIADAGIERSIDSIKIHQKKVQEEQEKGLEALSKMISRQKNIAQTIGGEIDLHNEIIDDLGDHITRTDIRVVDETSRVQIVNKKDRTCGYWIIIILLFITIVVIAVV